MHHAPRRLAVLALATAVIGTLLAVVPAGVAAAAIIKPIAFPVDGAVTYTRDFGAPRSGGRTHEGNDLMGKKMMPELAAVNGTVFRLTFNNLSTGGNSVTIKGDDGWTYHYIHVNNDTPGTDDGAATRDQAFPSNIVVGARVTKGQVIAFMGDSGNAETTAPHLHFEIRQPAAAGQYTGAAIDPYDSLQAAARTGVGRWDLRRTATGGTIEDSFVYGQAGDLALMCDWDADGIDEPVIVRAETWYLRSGLSSGSTARRVTFGSASTLPACGDIDGDGADEAMVFSDGTWTIRDSFGLDATAAATTTIAYGTAGDVPVIGDWNGNGADDLGVRRGGTWYLRSTGTATGRTMTRFDYGYASDGPVAGDWDGNGADEPGAYRNGDWYLRANSATSAPTARRLRLGTAAERPVAGEWIAAGVPAVGTWRP